jgi:prepilin-type N-terminal cleavage/methylation domain-containing protein
MNRPLSSSRQAGFSLVELSIALVVIGLCIGGVLKGMEMIENSRNANIIKDYKSFSAAVGTFKNMYGAFPGDIANATTRLAKCTGANNCTNGNRNDVVGTSVSQIWIPADNSSINDENVQFWKHLALANLISGVSESASSIGRKISNPPVGSKSAFFVIHTLDNRWQNLPDHYFAIKQNPNGGWDCNDANSSCGLSPLVASQLDTKLDDGIALSKNIISFSANVNSGCGFPNAGQQGVNGYSTDKTYASCHTFLRFRQ